MTIYDRIKNNKNWPLEVNSVLYNKSVLILDTLTITPLCLVEYNRTSHCSLTKEGKKDVSSNSKCLISPKHTNSWENVYYPKVGEYVTRKDVGDVKIIMYVTSLQENFAIGISFVEFSNLITNVSKFYYEGRTERRLSTQEEIDLFNSKLKEQNLQIINNEIVNIENKLPKSWEEYCNNPIKEGYILFSDGIVSEKVNTKIYPGYKSTTFPTKDLAEAIKAFKKLIILRQVWIKDWKPTEEERYYGIFVNNYKNLEISIISFSQIRRNFSFPTKEMAEEFLETFKDLFIKAIPVL